MQSVAWSKVKMSEGWKSFRVAIKEKEKIKALAIVLSTEISHGKKFFIFSTGSGFKMAC